MDAVWDVLPKSAADVAALPPQALAAALLALALLVVLISRVLFGGGSKSRGGSRSVTLFGAPGAGKTALLHVAAGHAFPATVRRPFLGAECDPFGSSPDII